MVKHLLYKFLLLVQLPDLQLDMVSDQNIVLAQILKCHMSYASVNVRLTIVYIKY